MVVEETGGAVEVLQQHPAVSPLLPVMEEGALDLQDTLVLSIEEEDAFFTTAATTAAHRPAMSLTG